MKSRTFITLFLFLVVISLGTGCTKRFNISLPTASSIKYEEPKETKGGISIDDARSPEDKALSVGTLNAQLINLEDELQWLAKGIEDELKARGVNASVTKGQGSPYQLTVKKFRIRNRRSSGFSPYLTFTTLAMDLKTEYGTKRVTAYFKNGKVPVVAFREVEDPCYNEPLSHIVKEIASKINTVLYKYKAPDSKVDELSQIINGVFDKQTYHKVLELGYTNNPKAVPTLVKLTEHSDSMMRATALSALGTLNAVDQLPLLIKHYQSTDNTEQFMALKAIGDLQDPKAKEFLRSVMNSPDYSNQMIKEVVDMYNVDEDYREPPLSIPNDEQPSSDEITSESDDAPADSDVSSDN